jgi:AcrR family transcriptional regulator
MRRAERVMRSAILTTTAELAGAEGWDAVSLRKIAARMGYTAPIVYEHFRGKDGLLRAVVEDGFAELADALAAALCAARALPPQQRLQHLGVAYWDFAMRRPHLYTLMHSHPGIPFGRPETPEPLRRGFALLRTAVADLNPTTRADSDADSDLDPDDPTDVLWAILHGMTSLALQERIKGGSARARRLLTEAIGTFAAAHRNADDVP